MLYQIWRIFKAHRFSSKAESPRNHVLSYPKFSHIFCQIVDPQLEAINRSAKKSDFKNIFLLTCYTEFKPF